MVTGHVNLIKKFGDMGFPAGTFHKGPWRTMNDIYERLERDLDDNDVIITAPSQVHGSEIVFAENQPHGGNMVADGVLSYAGNICLTVKTADCLPLLLAEPESGLFGALHIGWRGLVGGIIENLFIAIKNLDMDFDRLYIYLGPCIGDCCFEVGDDVAIFFEDDFVRIDNTRHFVDFTGIVRERLLILGALKDRIIDADECTSCRSDKYYSFRRDRHAPIQMLSFIRRK